MSLPLFRRPGGIVFVDDDVDYLEMLALVLPRDWHVRLFTHPIQCVQSILHERRLWESDTWQQQQLVDRWHQGRPLVPQVLAYWAQASERFAMSHVCVVDFFMPGIDGLQVLSELVDWPGAKVLLTGQADERIAVGAFNRGLIHHYIPKQATDIRTELTETLGLLAQRPHLVHDPVWRTTLRPWQQALLQEPGIQQALCDIARVQWVEHVVIGDPFGILGLDAEGQVSWLQLETPAGLKGMAELAEVEGVDATSRAHIRAGRRLVSLELRQSLGLHGPCESVAATRLGHEGKLLAALFPLEAPLLPHRPQAYRQWLAQQPGRGLAG